MQAATGVPGFPEYLCMSVVFIESRRRPDLDDQVQEAFVTGRDLSLTDRMWWLWMWRSHCHGYVSLHRSTMMRMLGAPSLQAISDSAHSLVRWKLYRYDQKLRRWDRLYLKDETDVQWVARCRRCPGVSASARVARLLTDLTHAGPAPVSRAQMAADLGLGESTVSRVLRWIHENTSHFEQYGGAGRGRRSMFIRAGDPAGPSFEARLGAHYRDEDEPRKGIVPAIERVSYRLSYWASKGYRTGYGIETRPRDRVNRTETRPRPRGEVAVAVATQGQDDFPSLVDPAIDLVPAPPSIIGSSPPPREVQHLPDPASPKPRVVNLFPGKPAKAALLVVRRSSGGNFVRDKTQVYAQIDSLLTRARIARWNRRQELKGTYKWLDKLCRELDGPAPVLRVLAVAAWYADEQPWERDKMVPWVDGGPSLYEKFSRLEACMRRMKPAEMEDDETPRDVLRAAVGGDGPVLTSLEKDVFAPARKLRLTGDDLELARALVRLHASIRAERAAAGVSDDLVRQLGGVVGLLARYVAFLGDQGWIATLKVLQPDSPAFAQFRRGQIQLDARDRDPVTGKSYW